MIWNSPEQQLHHFESFDIWKYDVDRNVYRRRAQKGSFSGINSDFHSCPENKSQDSEQTFSGEQIYFKTENFVYWAK